MDSPKVFLKVFAHLAKRSDAPALKISERKEVVMPGLWVMGIHVLLRRVEGLE